MADAAPPARGGGRGRGRGNGQRVPRGGSQGTNGAEQPDPTSPNARGGRQRGGRGGRGRGRGGSAFVAQEQDRLEPRNAKAIREEILASGRADLEGKGKNPLSGEVEAEDEEDAEVCFICASPVIHQALSPCNHRTCHICALRLRALYKTRACAHCRSLSDSVIFTDDTERRYEDFQDGKFFKIDPNLGIKYDKAEMYEDTLVLLRYNCPNEDCDVACLGWPDLHRHVKNVHHQWMCDLCARNKKVFTHEHELFSHNDLRKHEKFGDDNPGAIDQTGFKGHPECGFCRIRFYGDDELYVHCREKHEKCHICDRRNPQRNPDYYQDYNNLELHFRKDHFLCPDAECLEKKFVVFESEIDLKAHQVEAHPGGMSGQALRDARRVDMRNFGQFHERYQPERGRGRGRREGPGRESGRGRDPNSEPLPQSSAQSIGRAELAFQREQAIQSERAIQSAQSIAPRTFGGRLTAAEPALAVRPTTQTPSSIHPPRSTPENSFPSLSSLRPTLDSRAPRPTSPAPEITETPQEKARRLRHSAVIERASGMLGNDQRKIAEFRDKISSFKNSKITAPELIEAFFSLFDRPTAEVGKLVKELAEIFEIASHRESLLKAWNDWKAINEDYPSLPGSSAASTTGTAPSYGSKRVLKLKTSTAPSARSAVGKTGGWGSTSNASLFPSLPAGAASRSKASVTPWAGSSSGSASRAQAPPSRPVSRPAASAMTGSTDAFPALPMASRSTGVYSSLGSTSSGVLRPKNLPTTASPWGGVSTASSGTDTPNAEAESETLDNQKKRGNKKKGQTLLRFG
ncbi:hypothetical protein EJ08DRAFT_734659 [Tothia fuscella]|uniref:RING-type E3 ubiquitin transferase n=1 Tax=Tothia fuscella TaxID=1048955 RepID=A0A9P4TYJ0_9PEZI|nr:hypothetical protein EJ08DRAFT_734659 [Tothia fuscella]